MTTRKTTPAEEGFTVVRIDYARLERLREIAKREDRSVASVLRRVIDRELEEETAA